MTITGATLIGQEMIKYYCRACKKELSKTDALIICDKCLLGGKNE